LEGD
jgi:hypothetical protein